MRSRTRRVVQPKAMKAKFQKMDTEAARAKRWRRFNRPVKPAVRLTRAR